MSDLLVERQQLVVIEECWVERGSPCAWAGCIHDFVDGKIYDFHNSYKCLTRDFNLMLALADLLPRIGKSICVDVVTNNLNFIDNMNKKLNSYHQGRSESDYPAQHNIIERLAKDFMRLHVDFRKPDRKMENEICQTLKEQAEHWQEQRSRSMGLGGGHY